MRLGSEVDDIVEIVLLEQRSNQFLVADIALHEHMTGIPLHALQILKIACIGQLVEVDKQDVVIFLQHVVNKVGADKSGATSDQIFLHVFSSPILR